VSWDEPDFDDVREIRHPRWRVALIVAVAAAMLLSILIPVVIMALEL
jgi:hypothetical protein